MKKIPKKLSLTKETLRNLSDDEQQQVVGGGLPIFTGFGCTILCATSWNSLCAFPSLIRPGGGDSFNYSDCHACA